MKKKNNVNKWTNIIVAEYAYVTFMEEDFDARAL